MLSIDTLLTCIYCKNCDETLLLVIIQKIIMIMKQNQEKNTDVKINHTTLNFVDSIIQHI